MRFDVLENVVREGLMRFDVQKSIYLAISVRR